MPDTTSDDVYDDPDNILAETDDSVDGAVELPERETDDLSQSIFVPEKDNPGDTRGSIDALEEADGTSKHDEMSGVYPEDEDPDSDHLADVMPPAERDGTEE